MAPTKVDLDTSKLLDKIQNAMDRKMDNSHKVLSTILDTINETIETKMDILNTSVTSVTDLLKSIADKFDTVISLVPSQIGATVESDTTYSVERCTEIITDLQNQMKETAKESFELKKEMHTMKVTDHAYKRKKSMQAIWNSKLNFIGQKYNLTRKYEVYSAQYDEWVTKGTFLPKRFRNFTERMNEEERNKATEKGFRAMKEESEKMIREAIKSSEKMRETENQLISLIETQEMKNVGEKMKEIWRIDIEKKKSQTDKKWVKKAKWLSDREHSGGDGDDDEAKMDKELENTTETSKKGTNKEPTKQHTTSKTYASVVNTPSTINIPNTANSTKSETHNGNQQAQRNKQAHPKTQAAHNNKANTYQPPHQRWNNKPANTWHQGGYQGYKHYQQTKFSHNVHKKPYQQYAAGGPRGQFQPTGYQGPRWQTHRYRFEHQQPFEQRTYQVSAPNARGYDSPYYVNYPPYRPSFTRFRVSQRNGHFLG